MNNFELVESKKSELAQAFQAFQDLQDSDVGKVIGFIMGVSAAKTLSQQNQTKHPTDVA